MGTLTDNLSLYKPDNGETGWGDEVNANFDVLDLQAGQDGIINVKDPAFGAVGDGATDDTAAIQAAIDYARADRYRGIIFFPPGEYVVTDKFRLGQDGLGGELLGVHHRLHFLGGANTSGYLTGQLPPAVFIDGTAITDDPIFEIFDTGDVHFENLMLDGGHQAIYANNLASLWFKNCSMRVGTSGNADNTPFYGENIFWSYFDHVAFSAPTTADYGMILKGALSDDVQSCGLLTFDHCQWNNGGINYHQDVAQAGGGMTFRQCVTEGFNGLAFIEFTEDGAVSDQYHTGSWVFENIIHADQLSNSPLIHMDAAHLNFNMPIFNGVLGSGEVLIEVDAGTLLNPIIMGTIGSGTLTKIQDGSGNPLACIRQKATGLDFRGTSADNTTTDLTSNHGNMLRFSRDGDAHARHGISSDGVHSWGAGGATSGWDTNLYRSAANVLKTDDKLVATGGLGVGNSAPATTPGSVTNKMEVFDASGVSLGFVAIYGSIT